MKYSTSPAFSFTHTQRLKLPREDPLFTPGPQVYSPIKLIFKNPRTVIGHAKRIPQIKETVPGPGTYNIPNLFPQGFKYSIGNQLFSKRNNNDLYITPGPGAYKILKKSSSCFYTFGSKYKEQKKDNSPGPGNYNIRNKKDLIKSSYIFGKARRILSSVNEDIRLSPGPANYKYNKDIIKIRNPKYSFGKEERKNKENSSPGPGAYNHKEFVGKEGQKISISEKFKHIYREINDLGPGQYNRTDLNFYKPKTPSVKIGKSKRFKFSKEILLSPGPAKYNNINSITVIKKNEPSWKIGTAKRRSLVHADKNIPGVGRYNLTKDTGKDSPHYTIRIKTKLIKDRLNTPGPGNYNIDKADTEIYKHNPFWKIGTARRLKSSNFNKITPGPGSYSINSLRTFRPRFAYTKQKRGYLTINDNPGPGAYHIPCSFEELNTYTRIKGKFDDKFRYI